MKRAATEVAVLLGIVVVPSAAIIVAQAVGTNSWVATAVSLIGAGSLFGAGATYNAMKGAIRGTKAGLARVEEQLVALNANSVRMQAALTDIKYYVGLEGDAGLGAQVDEMKGHQRRNTWEIAEIRHNLAPMYQTWLLPNAEYSDRASLRWKHEPGEPPRP